MISEKSPDIYIDTEGLLPIAILDLLIVARYLRKIISEDSSGTWPVASQSCRGGTASQGQFPRR